MTAETDPFAGVRAVIPPRKRAVLGPAGRATGLAVGYREGGDARAPAILFMHGIGSNATGFRYQFEGLGDAFRVVAWDAPGYGESDGFEDPAPPVGDYADAAAGLLDALGIERVHLCGSSMGAVIAVSFADRHPHRLKTLILSAPAPSADGVPAADRAKRAEQRIADLARLGADALAAERSAFLVAPDAPAHVLEAARDLVASVNRRGYAQGAYMVANAEYMAAAARIRTPTLIFRGTEDRLGAGAAPLAATIPGAVFESFPGAGHLLKLEAPARFNRLIRDFIARHGA